MSCFGKKKTPEERQQEERNKRIERQIKDDKQKYKATHRLLLLGNYKFILIRQTKGSSIRVFICSCDIIFKECRAFRLERLQSWEVVLPIQSLTSWNFFQSPTRSYLRMVR